MESRPVVSTRLNQIIANSGEIHVIILSHGIEVGSIIGPEIRNKGADKKEGKQPPQGDKTAQPSTSSSTGAYSQKKISRTRQKEDTVDVREMRHHRLRLNQTAADMRTRYATNVKRRDTLQAPAPAQHSC